MKIHMQTIQQCFSHVNSLTFQLVIRGSMQMINKNWRLVNSYNFKPQTTQAKPTVLEQTEHDHKLQPEVTFKNIILYILLN